MTVFDLTHALYNLYGFKLNGQSSWGKGISETNLKL
jgi:hypothetical protein